MSIWKTLFAHWGGWNQELALGQKARKSDISVRHALLCNATYLHVTILLAGVFTAFLVVGIVYNLSGRWTAMLPTLFFCLSYLYGLHIHVKASKLDLTADNAEASIEKYAWGMTIVAAIAASYWSFAIYLLWDNGTRQAEILGSALTFGIPAVGSMVYYSLPRVLAAWLIILASMTIILTTVINLPAYIYLGAVPFFFSLARMAMSQWGRLVDSFVNSHERAVQQEELHRTEIEKQRAIEKEVANSERIRADALRHAKEEREKELTSLAKEFEDTVFQVADGLGQAITSLRTTSLQLASTGTQASESTDEMADNSTSMAQAVHLVAAATEQLTSSAIGIAEQVGEQVAISQNAGTTCDESSEIIKKLADDVDRIGSVASLIQQVAGKTNLLALNASIEASRAGEAGKGFAVVATEIKTLASQTQGAIETVAQTVSNIREGMARAGQSVTSVVGEMEQVQLGARNISEVINEQKTATLDISDNARTASVNAENVLSCSSEVKATTHRVDEAADEMQQVVSALEGRTEQLKDSSSRFLAKLRVA